jgi:hypothetical protein
LKIDGHGQHLDALLLMRRIKVLPDWQLQAACSPRGPHIEDVLFAGIPREPHLATVKGGERQIGHPITDL